MTDVIDLLASVLELKSPLHAQLVAFLTFQIRVVVGLRALAASRA